MKTLKPWKPNSRKKTSMPPNNSENSEISCKDNSSWIKNSPKKIKTKTPSLLSSLQDCEKCPKNTRTLPSLLTQSKSVSKSWSPTINFTNSLKNTTNFPKTWKTSWPKTKSWESSTESQITLVLIWKKSRSLKNNNLKITRLSAENSRTKSKNLRLKEPNFVTDSGSTILCTQTRAIGTKTWLNSSWSL